MGKNFLNNQNNPIKCEANQYAPIPPIPLFFSSKLKEKWDKKRAEWIDVWCMTYKQCVK